MKAYQQRFHDHPLQAELSELWNVIERIKAKHAAPPEGNDTAGQDAMERAAFARLYRVAAFITNSIRRCAAALWTPTALNEAHAAVKTITTAFQQYEGARAIDHFEAAGDTALDHYRKVTLSRFSTTSREAEESYIRFCETAEAKLTEIGEYGRTIEEKKKAIETAKTDFQTRIAALGKQLEAHELQFEAQKARVDEMITAQQQAFQTAQAERATGMIIETDTRKTAFEQWTKDADAKMEKVIKSAQTDASANLAEMNKHLTRAKEILGIVAASGVAGHYKDTAERELSGANLYRRWAFFFFVIMAVVITYVVLSVKADHFRWEMGMFRVGVGMALLVPAFYCAKESAKHREAEKRNRRLQIELSTLEPYLEKLHNPQEMREILKEKAKSYFMGQMPREPDDDVEGRLSAKEWKRREDQFMEILKAFGASSKK